MSPVYGDIRSVPWKTRRIGQKQTLEAGFVVKSWSPQPLQQLGRGNHLRANDRHGRQQGG